MAIRKIKDAKDLSDDSLIYFKGHAKATYMSDGSTVEDAIKNIETNSGNIDLSDYETKIESQNKLQESKDYTDVKTDELRDVVTQTLSLTSNNNWCSFYVDITLEQLQQALGTNATSITTSYDGGETEVTSSYNADTNTWSGDLTVLDVTKMYMINANTSCEISLTGRKISNSTVYTLNPGWNWIGYPLNQEVDINTALKGLVATEGDKIKFRGNTFAEYFDGEWYPVDFVFEPGQGYMYQNTSTEPKTLVFTTELIDTKSELNKKQDVITDLDAIRQGAAKGATALLEHQDISSKADVYGNPNGIVVKEDNPQNSINIHPRGIIESESWKYNEAFSTEWIPYFLLSGNSLSLGSGASTDDGFKIEAVLNIRTQDRSDEEFLRTSHTMILLYDERGNSKGTGLLLTDDFILLYAYNPESEIDISENMTELEVPFNDSIFDTRLRGIAEPVSNHDAVNKKYVDDNYVSVNNIKTINGQSLLGEGDIVISGGGSSSGNGAYALVEHGTNDTTFTLTPNTFHVWGEVNSLTLTLGEEQSGVANEFLFQFESGETATTLTLPDDLIWANDDTPVIESNYTYQVSILKGFATLMKFKKAVLLEFTISIYEGFMMTERNETYLYKTGMTWGQWINSEYNTNGYYSIDEYGNVYNNNVEMTMSAETTVKYSTPADVFYVSSEDLIDGELNYTID